MHYHFVFAVKYRRALLDPPVVEHDPPVVEQLTRISREIEERYEFEIEERYEFEIEERYEFEIEALGADKNHVHLLCSAHPKVAAGDIVRIYKSLTAFTRA